MVSKKLGFKLIYTYNKNKVQIALLKLEKIKIELFYFVENTTALPNYRKDLLRDLHTVGTKHFCLEVSNLDNKIKDLKAKDVKFAQDIDTAGFGGKNIFFKDCNEILIELYER